MRIAPKVVLRPDRGTANPAPRGGEGSLGQHPACPAGVDRAAGLTRGSVATFQTVPSVAPMPPMRVARSWSPRQT